MKVYMVCVEFEGYDVLYEADMNYMYVLGIYDNIDTAKCKIQEHIEYLKNNYIDVNNQYERYADSDGDNIFIVGKYIGSEYVMEDCSYNLYVSVRTINETIDL